MTYVVIPYILPLLLGRTINLDTMQVGVDIFPKSEIENPILIHNPVTETRYKIVDSAVESRDLLDVEGAFSLKVKCGIFKGGVSGEYLSDPYNRENTVEVAVKATYQTVTEQLPADAKPFEMWRALGDGLGTHFVRSVIYGGEFVGALRVECNNTRDKMRVKGALDVGGKMEIFDLGAEIEGEYMKDVSKSVESTQIKVFSSVPLSSAPNNMETLKEAIKTFPDDVRDFNEGRGVPVRVELWPLAMLDPSRPARLKNRILEARLDSFELRFDDLLNTKSAVSDWMKSLSKPFNEEQEEKVGAFYGEVQKVIRSFYEVIGRLDMTGNTDQLKPANDAYGKSIPGMFYKKYQLLRQSITGDQGEWSPSRGNGATYVHWGRSSCTGVCETMSAGSAAGPGGQRGGGSDFLCLPEEPDSGDPPTNQGGAARLRDTSYQFPKDSPQKLMCSNCRLATKGAVQMFTSRKSCPSGWTYLYDGLLLSGSHDSTSTRFVCIDKAAERYQATDPSNPLVPNWSLLQTSENEDDENQLPTVCVICAK